MKKTAGFIIFFLFLNGCTAQRMDQDLAIANPIHSSEYKKIGDIFEVSLPINKTSGYVWKFSMSNPNVLQLINSSATNAKSDNKMGGSDVVVWKFQAINAGKVIINFDYLREWENRPNKTEKFEVNVN
jgi:predicted secreted protein